MIQENRFKEAIGFTQEAIQLDPEDADYFALKALILLHQKKFQEALDYTAQRPELPLSFCMAATCDEGEKLLLMLRAEDGEAYIVPADQNREPVYLNATLERLLPRVQFVYDI